MYKVFHGFQLLEGNISLKFLTSSFSLFLPSTLGISSPNLLQHSSGFLYPMLSFSLVYFVILGGVHILAPSSEVCMENNNKKLLIFYFVTTTTKSKLQKCCKHKNSTNVFIYLLPRFTFCYLTSFAFLLIPCE